MTNTFGHRSRPAWGFADDQPQPSAGSSRNRRPTAVSAPNRDLAAFVALVVFAVGLFKVGTYVSCGSFGEQQCRPDAAGMAFVGALLVVAGLGTLLWAMVEDHRDRVTQRDGDRRSA